MITKKEISEALALSCVESYFAAWINRYIDVTKLYCKSFISFKKVFEDFSHGAIYQNYYSFPRLQDVAEEHGLSEHEYRACSAEKALTVLANSEEDELCLVRVSAEFFVGFKRSSWREDHYICLDKDLNWLNHYPLSSGIYNRDEFKKIYGGAICVYKIKDVSVPLPDYVSEEFTKQDLSLIDFPSSLNNIESAVGVLRVSRKRLEQFYRGNEKVRDLLRKENDYLDNVYFNIRRSLLKAKDKDAVDKKRLEVIEQILRLIETEKRISELLRNGH